MLKIITIVVAMLLALSTPVIAEEYVVTGEYVLTASTSLGPGPGGGFAFEIVAAEVLPTIEECLARATEINLASLESNTPLISTCHPQILVGTNS